MKTLPSYRALNFVALAVVMVLIGCSAVLAQDNVTGALEGQVFDINKTPVADALVQFIERESGNQVARRTDSQGRYSRGLLPPGEYIVRVSKPGFVTQEKTFINYAMKTNLVLPPIFLLPETAAATPTTQPTPGQPTGTPTPTAHPQTPATGPAAAQTSVAGEMNRTDARRAGAYTDKEVPILPLGGATLTRSFDELGLLVPGVAPPPPTQGDVAGPGVGSGVGSAGQFAVNGMRSRSNNFTVDGSDNNDEDIGVRRQGFFSLVPQPIESIKEFQITTLLAPAQYGRNFGGQVNALSRSGGNQLHGTIFGFFNSSQLNSRNPFDTANGNATTPIRSASGQAALDCTGITFSVATLTQYNQYKSQCTTRNTALTTTNQSGGEDSSTLGQGGIVLGGPIKKDKAFFFVSYERQVLNASKEASFAVPTVDQRGVFNSGQTGFFIDCLDANPGFNLANCTNANRSQFFQDFAFPNSLQGDAVFSLFPFANNPGGVYGPNTYTEILPASARGNVASGKYDQNFNLRGRPQTFTARYNFTQDWRDIPVTGGALFSSLQPRVRTQNFSSFLTSELTNSLSNLLRVSYGRTRLVFDELRDPFLISSEISPNEPFLLNARRLENDVLPVNTGLPNTGPVLYRNSGTSECGLKDCDFGQGIGRVGQVNIAGFSPIGVDTNFFPQSRVNNTYQIADTLGYRRGNHTLAFGEDIRRIELNSDLPRNSRTLLTFNGAPELRFDANGDFSGFTGNFLTGTDLAAAGAPSGAFLSLARTGSAIGLRYYEYDFFGQDEWRIRQTLSLSFGLRYENNSPPREVHNLIEKTFNDPALNDPNVAGLKTFLEGRTQIFDPDHNNFEPRVGFAWAPRTSKGNRATVVRAGFGVFHDQILGAVVSQSRNVYPNFVTVNTGGFNDPSTGFFSYFNPARGGICNPSNCAATFTPLVQRGTLNTFNPSLTLSQVLNIFASGNAFPNAVSVTLPDRHLKTPASEQYSVTVEQQMRSNFLFSVGYIGTRGHNLLRASTPNLGPNNVIAPFDAGGLAYGTLSPVLVGFALAPGSPTANNFDRPQPDIGPVYIYDSGGRSRYDALQFQLRGRYHFIGSTQFQVNYTFSRGRDDASDVFDLAGSSSLPQDSLTLEGEYYRSNFDAMHRLAYDYVTDAPHFKNHTVQTIFGNLQIAGTGQFQTGLPFTINSIFDVNLDGNLTDRLNTTKGIVSTGDRSQPYRLTVNPASLLAPIGTDGSLRRNSFRGTNLFVSNVAVIKTIALSERYKFIFRTEIFNVLNRANYGIPVRFLESPWFGKSTNTVTPARRIQLSLKFSF
jgi:Carboxypeptidase regulatory-like domain